MHHSCCASLGKNGASGTTIAEWLSSLKNEQSCSLPFFFLSQKMQVAVNSKVVIMLLSFSKYKKQKTTGTFP